MFQAESIHPLGRSGAIHQSPGGQRLAVFGAAPELAARPRPFRQHPRLPESAVAFRPFVRSGPSRSNPVVGPCHGGPWDAWLARAPGAGPLALGPFGPREPSLVPPSRCLRALATAGPRRPVWAVRRHAGRKGMRRRFPGTWSASTGRTKPRGVDRTRARAANSTGPASAPPVSALRGQSCRAAWSAPKRAARGGRARPGTQRPSFGPWPFRCHGPAAQRRPVPSEQPAAVARPPRAKKTVDPPGGRPATPLPLVSRPAGRS